MANTGIQIPTNFTLLAKLLLDFRGSFDTVADMAAFPESSLASGQITYCLDSKKVYIFDDSNAADPITGKWITLKGDPGDDSIEQWVSGKTYNVNTVVIFNDEIYICKTGNNDTIFDTAKWKSLSSAQSSLKDWVSSTSYVAGDFVINNKKIYRCVNPNNDAIFTESNWELIGGGKSIENWVANTPYVVDDLVIHNNILYQCTTPNSDSTFTDTNWQEIGKTGEFFVTSDHTTLSGITPNKPTVAFVTTNEQGTDPSGDPIITNPKGFYIFDNSLGSGSWSLIIDLNVATSGSGSTGTGDITDQEFEDMFT